MTETQSKTAIEKRCILCNTSKDETHFMVQNESSLCICLFCICTGIEVLVETSKDAEDQIRMALRLASSERHRNRALQAVTSAIHKLVSK